MKTGAEIPLIPHLEGRNTKLMLNWIFTGGIILGNLIVILLILGSERLRKSSKYILVASLAFADLSDGGCFLPMWTDIFINLQINYSCKTRYLAGALGYGIACVCSLFVVALNIDFTLRRAFPHYKGRNRLKVILVLVLICWAGPCMALGPIVSSGMKDSNPIHCFFTLDHHLVVFFLLAFFVPAGAILVSTGFVIFVHLKTKDNSVHRSFTQDTAFPSDVVTIACLTLAFYLPFSVLQFAGYYCNPQDCYSVFVSRFLVIGNLVYAKSAILPWIWLFSRGFRKEVWNMFCVTTANDNAD